jgi:hypothetical protein
MRNTAGAEHEASHAEEGKQSRTYAAQTTGGHTLIRNSYYYNNVDLPWVKLIRNSYYYKEVPHAITVCGSFW